MKTAPTPAETAGVDPDEIIDGIVKNIVDKVPPQSVLNQSASLLGDKLNFDNNDIDNDYDQTE